MRLSDPHAELPIKNHKYVKNCTELYLAQRGIDKIAHFEAFVNLEVLWINDNQVRTCDLRTSKGARAITQCALSFSWSVWMDWTRVCESSSSTRRTTASGALLTLH